MSRRRRLTIRRKRQRAITADSRRSVVISPWSEQAPFRTDCDGTSEERAPWNRVICRCPGSIADMTSTGHAADLEDESTVRPSGAPDLPDQRREPTHRHSAGKSSPAGTVNLRERTAVALVPRLHDAARHHNDVPPARVGQEGDK